jgi:hypothetical protein
MIWLDSGRVPGGAIAPSPPPKLVSRLPSEARRRTILTLSVLPNATFPPISTRPCESTASAGVARKWFV